MREQYNKVLNGDVKQIHSRLMDCLVEDTKENVAQFNDRGVFMGKVGAKKFYALYKPPYMRMLSFLTVIRGDISGTEDGKTRIRFRFGKFKTAIISSSVLFAIVTVVAIYAFISTASAIAVDICISGFWLLSGALCGFCMISSKAAKHRLLSFIEELDDFAKEQ